MKNINNGIIVFLALVIILVFAHFCGGDKTQTEYDKQKKIIEQIEQVRLKEKDSLSNLLAQSEEENKTLKSKNDSILSAIKTVKNRPKKQPKNLDELEEYFEKRYETDEVRTVDGKELATSENVAKKVVFELESFDIEKEVSLFKDMIIENQKNMILNLENDKYHLSLLNNSAEKEILERNKGQILADESIANLKRKNEIGKVAVGGAFVVGVIIGSVINK